jgi:hypothetical protein
LRPWNSDFPPLFVGSPTARSAIIPGAVGNMYALSTLSWFWVPVILMAMPVQTGLTMQHVDAVLINTGALFDFQSLVDVVHTMFVGGQFRLVRQEIVARAGRAVYIAASAQDRLRDMLNAARPDLMSTVSSWINHLYYCELLYLNRQAVAPRQDIEADGWVAHLYRNMSTQSIVQVPAPAMGMQVSVDINQWRASVTVPDLRAELLLSNICLGHNTHRETVLLRRRLLIARNVSVLNSHQQGA